MRSRCGIGLGLLSGGIDGGNGYDEEGGKHWDKEAMRFHIFLLLSVLQSVA